MKRIAIILTLAASLFLVVPLQAEEITKPDRYRLWNNCKPVGLIMTLIPPQEVDKVVPESMRSNIRLEQEEVKAAARSRLQDAGLYSAEPITSVFSVLWMSVDVSGESFEIKTNFRKRLIDPASGESALADTWELMNAFVGKKLDVDDYREMALLLMPKNHSNDPGYVLYAVSQHTDKFIEEYLRINADACAHR